MRSNRLFAKRKCTECYKEQDPEKVRQYLEAIADIPKESIAYIDETGIAQYLYREYCRAKKGVKITGKISGKKFKSVGIVAAKMGKKIIAPLQYDGTMDSSLFEIWFETRLLPALPKSTTITMDNASFHRKSKLTSLAEKYGHKIIFLPPYAPELNDIEYFWSWLKNRLRKILPYFGSLDEAISDCF